MVIYYSMGNQLMKIQYKDQQFQIDAVNAVTSVFEGQPKQTSSSYVMDIGNEKM